MTLSRWILPLIIAAMVATAVVTDTWLYLLFAIPGLLFVALAIAYPRQALLVWLVLAPVADAYATIELPGPDLTFSRVAITLVTIVLLLRMNLSGRRIVPLGVIELVLPMFLAIAVVDLVLRSGNVVSNALQVFDLYVTPVLVFFISRRLFADDMPGRQAKRVLYCVVAVGCYLAVHGAYQQIAGPSGALSPRTEISVEGGERTNESHLAEGRSVGPFGNAVEYGSVAAIAFLATLVLMLHFTRPLGRLWLTPALGAVAAAVVMSATRSVWLGAYLGLVTVAIFDRGRRRTLLPIAGAVALAAVAALKIASPAVEESASLSERIYSMEPIAARTVMYRVAARLVITKPLFGYGRGEASRVAGRRALYEVAGADAQWAPGQFHNVFLALLVEWGVVGLTAYAAIFVLFIRGGLALRRRVGSSGGPAYHFANFFLAATVVTLVQGLLVDLPAFLYLNSAYFLLAGLLFAELDATAARADDRDAAVITARGPSIPALATGRQESMPSRT